MLEQLMQMVSNNVELLLVLFSVAFYLILHFRLLKYVYKILICAFVFYSVLSILTFTEVEAIVEFYSKTTKLVYLGLYSIDECVQYLMMKGENFTKLFNLSLSKEVIPLASFSFEKACTFFGSISLVLVTLTIVLPHLKAIKFNKKVEKEVQKESSSLYRLLGVFRL